MNEVLNIVDFIKRMKKNFLFFLLLSLLASSVTALFFQAKISFKSNAIVKVNTELSSSNINLLNGVIPFQELPRDSYEAEIIQIINSRDFIISLIDDNKFLKVLIAAESYDTRDNKVIYNKKLYDEEKNLWKGDFARFNNDELDLVDYAFIQESFLNDLDIYQIDPLFYSIDFYSISPNFSKEVLDALIKKVNEHFMSIEIAKAENKINFLNSEYNSAQIIGLKESITDQISSQIEQLVNVKSIEEIALIRLDNPSMQSLDDAKNMQSRKNFIRIFIAGFSPVLIMIILSFLGFFIRFKKSAPFIEYGKS
tara:strand:- start:1610 stop:2539 length:930 start_codon:yes stop_codon:yes gene_type:complete